MFNITLIAPLTSVLNVTLLTKQAGEEASVRAYHSPVLTSMGAVEGSWATVTATSTESLVVAGLTSSLTVRTSALSITGLRSVVLMSATLSLKFSLFSSLGLSWGAGEREGEGWESDFFVLCKLSCEEVNVCMGGGWRREDMLDMRWSCWRKVCVCVCVAEGCVYIA